MNKSTTSKTTNGELAVEVKIPHSRPTLETDDRTAVAQAIDGGILVGGERLSRFERDLAAYFGRRQATAVSSGSAAIHLALKGLEIGAGDQVALPSYACVSLLQAVRRAKAEPLLIDCDPSNYCMDPDDLRRRLNGRVRAVLIVHSFGHPLGLDGFQLGPPVVEDVATALGARLHGRPAGSDGGAVVCSFNATKMITTGGGGAVVSDDPAFSQSVVDLVDYDERTDAAVRFNERMGELAAALGCSQLGKLASFVERRRALAGIYRDELDDANVVLPPARNGCQPSWHRFVIRIAGGAQWIRARLKQCGIASPRPIHQPLHWILGRGGYPGAETAHREALSLPIYPTLSDDDARTVAREVRRCLERR